MRGSVIKRGNAWSVVLDLGRDHTGRRIRRWHSGFRTRKDAERARIELLNRVEQGTYVAASKMTLGEFILEEWLPAMRAVVRPTTWEHYAVCANVRVIPALGGVVLQSLTPGRLNAFYADLLASGRSDGKGGLSPKTVRHTHTMLHKALADAVRWGRLVRNVADLADPPKPQTPEMKVWAPAEVRAFLDFVRDDRVYAAWLLVATTGMRRGEVLGLRWSDLDLDIGRVSVAQTLTVVNQKVRVSEPKTAKGRRTVALDPATVAALRAHRARQAEERLVLGPAWQEHGLIFTWYDGGPIHPERFSKWFEVRAIRSGLPRIRLHDLRHSYATAALAANVSPKVVSERLGHAKVGITLDVYSHVLPSMDEQAALTVARLILGDDADAKADGQG
jgi:integrase